MGSQLTRDYKVTEIPWLDAQTNALLWASIAEVAQTFPELLAVILYGSVARHDERPLTARHPSDVDVLFLFDRDTGLDFEERRRLFHALGVAMDRHLDAPREVQAMLATRTLDEWDPTFVENVARDGLLLWSRGPLPATLAAVEQHTLPASARPR